MSSDESVSSTTELVTSSVAINESETLDSSERRFGEASTIFQQKTFCSKKNYQRFGESAKSCSKQVSQGCSERSKLFNRQIFQGYNEEIIAYSKPVFQGCNEGYQACNRPMTPGTYNDGSKSYCKQVIKGFNEIYPHNLNAKTNEHFTACRSSPFKCQTRSDNYKQPNVTDDAIESGQPLFNNLYKPSTNRNTRIYQPHDSISVGETDYAIMRTSKELHPPTSICIVEEPDSLTSLEILCLRKPPPACHFSCRVSGYV